MWGENMSHLLWHSMTLVVLHLSFLEKYGLMRVYVRNLKYVVDLVKVLTI